MPDVELDDFKSDKKQEEIDKFDSFITNTPTGYRDSNLSLAITKKVEIMFGCKSYYLINTTFQDAVQKYVINGEQLDFDPKQSKLGFEKVPMIRRNIKKQKGHPDEDKTSWDFSDVFGSKLGQTYKHKKYMGLLKKSHMGQQKQIIPNIKRKKR